MLKNNGEYEEHKHIEDQIKLDNVAVFYYLSQRFNFQRVTETSMSCIERCFPIFAESNNFLELDFLSVAKILASSELNVDSESEVFNAAVAWISYRTDERKKYANHLLSKVRYSSLTHLKKRYGLGESSSLKINDDCFALVENFMQNEKLANPNKTFRSSRYCSQTKFNIAMCGGVDYEIEKPVNSVVCLDLKNLNNAKALPKLSNERHNIEVVCIKNEIYVFGGFYYLREPIRTVEKYSSATGTWEKIADMLDDRCRFCSCSLADKFYLFGGISESDDASSSCVEFDTLKRSWKEMAGMNGARYDAACAVINSFNSF